MSKLNKTVVSRITLHSSVFLISKVFHSVLISSRAHEILKCNVKILGVVLTMWREFPVLQFEDSCSCLPILVISLGSCTS